MRLHLFAAVSAWSSAVLPTGEMSMGEDDSRVLQELRGSDKPLMRIMELCGMPKSRTHLETFLRMSESALATDCPDRLLSIYKLMKSYVTGLQRYLPPGNGYKYAGEPKCDIAEMPESRHDRMLRVLENERLATLGQLGSKNKGVVGSYLLKGVGSDPLQSLAVDVEKTLPLGLLGEIASYYANADQFKVLSFIPDLHVVLLLVRRDGGLYSLYLWRGGGDKLQISGQARQSDAHNCYLKLSADRSHFYIVAVTKPSNSFRVWVGSPEPFTEIEETKYKSFAEPVIDGDFLEIDGKVTDLASLWQVGKVDHPLPEDFVLRSNPRTRTVALVDRTNARLVETFRLNCLDFGQMLPDTKDPATVMLRSICSMLIGPVRYEDQALELIEVFTRGKRRSDGDIARMFGAVMDQRSVEVEELKLKGKRKRPFDLVEGTPDVLPSSPVASEVLARFDTEQASLLADKDLAADVDALEAVLALE